ncbi:MAG: dihydroorotase, partial [Opitutae bacterium]
MFDLVIRGGSAVLPDQGEMPRDIAINDGKVAAILSPTAKVESASSIDAAGHVILPGVIDVHLHLGHGADISRPRVPADADRETDAAARGGVTCMIPYLMASEPFEDIFDDVRAVTEAGSRIDFSYHFIISTEEQLARVPHYVKMGAPSFKIFMNNRGGEGLRLGLPDIDDGFL